ncbi:MAG: hypothetical protein GX613_15520 [Chloroflexi bacterium]|nr:hypothetical protein [Chloroflexota bacterium]
MTEDLQRRSLDGEPLDVEPQDDRFIEAIRDIPKMRSIDDGKRFSPPPPMISRIGAVTQGCGAVALTLIAVVMLLTAMLYGFYVWGPSMMLIGGLALLFGTAGVWRGVRTALLVAIPVLLGLAVIAALWGSYLPAAAALAPLGNFNVMLPLVVIGAVFILLLTLILHVVSLFYWNRLKPFSQRGLIVWGAVIGFLLVLAVGFHFVQQNQRESWMDEHLDDWTARAETDTLRLGANSNVTLGYSFVTAEDTTDGAADEPASNVPIEERMAELDAIIDSGALVLRLGASGDMLFESDESVLFTAASTEEGADSEDEGEDADTTVPAERIAQQQAYEEEFMQRVVGSGIDLVIADSQYTPYLLVKGGEEDDIAWDDFRAYHRQRVEHYASQYQPYAYEIVNEPAAYSDYSDLADFESAEQQLELWIEHTQDLIDLVREVSPETLVGVSIASQTEFDLDYYERVLELGIDFVAFRVYQPAQYDLIEDALAERGRPQEHGAELWLSETWYGYCLAPQRSMALDAEWLETAVAFVARYDGGVVLPNDFGCFLQPGGTLFAAEIEEGGRTEVWETWQRLIAEWAPS